MKLKELMKELKGQYDDVLEYSWCGNKHDYHTSNIQSIYDGNGDIIPEYEVLDYEIMDIERMDNTIFADGECFAKDIYEDDVKVLVAIVKESDNLLQIKRIKYGLSQSQLAKKANVNLRTLQNYEQGLKDLSKASVSTVKALADALECKIEDII